jgi:branched-chain amino acid transport system substrate-binding protein
LSGASETLRLTTVALLFAACSLTRPEVTECSSSSRCREVFGPGHVCNSDGLCEKTGSNPRCASAHPEDLLTRPENHPDAIIFGALMDHSVTTQVARENAIRLAATQVAEKQGLWGHELGVVFCDIAKDSKYDSLDRTQAAIASAHYLADAIGVPAIVGPSSSTDTLGVFQALKGQDVLVISPSATSPALTDAEGFTPTDGKPGMLWRTAPPDTIQGLAIAKYLQGLSPQVGSVEVVAEKGPYGEGLAAVFLQAFPGGGSVAHLSLFSSTSERDAAVVAAGKTASEWVLFVSSQTPDASAFLNAAATIGGYSTKNLFLTDSAANTDLLTNAAGASSLFPRVRGSRPAVPQGAVYEQFRASFTAAFQADANDFSFVAHAYDATWLVFYGSAWSLGQDSLVHGRGIARGLRHVSLGPAANIEPDTWNDIVAELGSQRGVDVTGASGDLNYDPVTEETSGPTDIWKISTDGQSIEIESTIKP